MTGSAKESRARANPTIRGRIVVGIAVSAIGTARTKRYDFGIAAEVTSAVISLRTLVAVVKYSKLLKSR